jgi:O-antigen/teichoic acid export membrane protein
MSTTTITQLPDEAETTTDAADVVRGSVPNFVFRLLSACSDSLVVVITARGFGVEGRGLYAIASLVGSMIVTTLGGTYAAMGGEYVHGRAGLGRLHAAMFVIAAIGGVVIGAALGLAVAVSWPHAEVLLFPAVTAPALILNVIQYYGFLAVDDVPAWRKVFLATSVVPMLTLGVCAIAAPGRIWLALALWSVALYIVPLYTLRMQTRRARFDFGQLRPVIRRLLVRGAPVSAANAMQLLNYRVDLIVVVAMLPLSAVGRYSVAVVLAEALLIATRAISSTVYGKIPTRSERQAVELTVTAVRHSLIVGAAGMVAIAVGGRLLLGPVVGSSFTRAWVPMTILMPGVVALGLGEQFKPYLLIRLERSREYMISATGAMLVNLGLAIALIPTLGLDGAALSTTVSYLGGALYLAWRSASLAGTKRLTIFLPRRNDLAVYAHILVRAGHVVTRLVLRNHRSTEYAA